LGLGSGTSILAGWLSVAASKALMAGLGRGNGGLPAATALSAPHTSAMTMEAAPIRRNPSKVSPRKTCYPPDES
jgi:hypothetical protein